jgi:hypothetical protein
VIALSAPTFLKHPSRDLPSSVFTQLFGVQNLLPQLFDIFDVYIISLQVADGQNWTELLHKVLPNLLGFLLLSSSAK